MTLAHTLPALNESSVSCVLGLLELRGTLESSRRAVGGGRDVGGVYGDDCRSSAASGGMSVQALGAWRKAQGFAGIESSFTVNKGSFKNGELMTCEPTGIALAEKRESSYRWV